MSILVKPVFLGSGFELNIRPSDIKLDIHDELPQPVIQTVNQVANSILENINKAVVINPISLISLILLNAEHHTLTEHDLIAKIDQYRHLLKRTKYDAKMMMTELSSAEIIQYAAKLNRLRSLAKMINWVRVAESQKILLSYFSNNILHCFILPALIAMLVHSYKKISITLFNRYP